MMSYLRQRRFYLMLVVLGLVTGLVFACTTLQSGNSPGRPRYEALLNIKSTFVDGVRTHDLASLRPILGNVAEEKMEQWLQTHAYLPCQYVMRDYEASYSGGSIYSAAELEQANLVTRAFMDVQVPCAAPERGRWLGLYKLTIRDVTFAYNAEGWQITEWGEIEEYIDDLQ